MEIMQVLNLLTITCFKLAYSWSFPSKTATSSVVSIGKEMPSGISSRIDISWFAKKAISSFISTTLSFSSWSNLRICRYNAEMVLNLRHYFRIHFIALSPMSENISIVINRKFSMLDEDHCHFSHRHYLNATLVKYIFMSFCILHQQLILIN